jgi:hypothetical protein
MSFTKTKHVEDEEVARHPSVRRRARRSTNPQVLASIDAYWSARSDLLATHKIKLGEWIVYDGVHGLVMVTDDKTEAKRAKRENVYSYMVQVGCVERVSFHSATLYDLNTPMADFTFSKDLMGQAGERKDDEELKVTFRSLIDSGASTGLARRSQLTDVLSEADWVNPRTATCTGYYRGELSMHELVVSHGTTVLGASEIGVYDDTEDGAISHIVGLEQHAQDLANFASQALMSENITPKDVFDECQAEQDSDTILNQSLALQLRFVLARMLARDDPAALATMLQNECNRMKQTADPLPSLLMRAAVQETRIVKVVKLRVGLLES